MLGGGLSRSRIRSRRRFRGRVRCENAGLSDKAEDGSQKQNVFYHRFLFNTLKNAKFRKKNLRHKAKNEPADRRPPGPICARASDRCRAMSVERYLLNVLNECIELLSITGWVGGLLIVASGSR